MSAATSLQDQYKQQLTCWAQSLAEGRPEGLQETLAEGSSCQDVKRYLANADAERYQVLVDELGFVALAFSNLEALIAAFVQAVPLRAHHLDTTDHERFLEWLRWTQPLTPQQQDFVSYQQAEYAVLAEARRQRSEHLQFQRRWALAGQRGNDLVTNPHLQVHLNPIRVWSRLNLPTTGYVEDAEPRDVLFFAQGSQVRSICLDTGQQQHVGELASFAPCSLADWEQRGRSAERTQLAAVCRELADTGLVAFE